MATMITKHIEGHYEARIDLPEKAWVEILGGKLLTDDLTIVSLALSRGLLELMSIFGRPEKTD